jgi:hypothetical protein
MDGECADIQNILSFSMNIQTLKIKSEQTTDHPQVLTQQGSHSVIMKNSKAKTFCD